jgi:integrase
VPAKHETDRREGVYRRLNTWLRERGVTSDAGKIAYRLRKYFLNKVAEQQGTLFAQAAAGHSSLQTTESHYIGKPKMAKPIKLIPS